RRLVSYSSVSTPPVVGGKLAASSSERTAWQTSARGQRAAGQSDVEGQVSRRGHQLTHGTAAELHEGDEHHERGQQIRDAQADGGARQTERLRAEGLECDRGHAE